MLVRFWAKFRIHNIANSDIEAKFSQILTKCEWIGLAPRILTHSERVCPSLLPQFCAEIVERGVETVIMVYGYDFKMIKDWFLKNAISEIQVIVLKPIVLAICTNVPLNTLGFEVVTTNLLLLIFFPFAVKKKSLNKKNLDFFFCFT